MNNESIENHITSMTKIVEKLDNVINHQDELVVHVYDEVSILKLPSISQIQNILANHLKWLNGDKDGIRADLSDMDLSCKNLNGVNLRHAILNNTDLSFTTLIKADMSYTEMNNVNLTSSDLVDANLCCANINESDLKLANLKFANLINAKIHNSKLINSDLIGCKLLNVDLSGTDLSGAKLDYTYIPILYGDMDDTQIKQILHNVIRTAYKSPNISEDIKHKLFNEDNLSIVDGAYKEIVKSDEILLNNCRRYKTGFCSTSDIPYELRKKQWDMEKRIKEELKNPNFLDMYTRKTLRNVMIALFPYETMINPANRAFIGMTKVRMYNHLKGYAILKGWIEI